MILEWLTFLDHTIMYVVNYRLVRKIVNEDLNENFDDLFRHLIVNQQYLTVYI